MTITIETAITQAIESVCSDGNSDVKRVVHDVLSNLTEAGYQVIEVQPTAADIHATSLRAWMASYTQTRVSMWDAQAIISFLLKSGWKEPT